MEETLFEPDGTPVAYVDYDGDSTIYLWKGVPVAYLDKDNCIYGFNGKHLGWYENGVIWNLKGERNGYNKNTLPVYARYEPYKSYKNYKPYKSYKQYANNKPSKKLTKSQESLSQFLSRGKN